LIHCYQNQGSLSTNFAAPHIPRRDVGITGEHVEHAEITEELKTDGNIPYRTFLRRDHFSRVKYETHFRIVKDFLPRKEASEGN